MWELGDGRGFSPNVRRRQAGSSSKQAGLAHFAADRAARSRQRQVDEGSSRRHPLGLLDQWSNSLETTMGPLTSSASFSASSPPSTKTQCPAASQADRRLTSAQGRSAGWRHAERRLASAQGRSAGWRHELASSSARQNGRHATQLQSTAQDWRSTSFLPLFVRPPTRPPTHPPTPPLKPWFLASLRQKLLMPS